MKKLYLSPVVREAGIKYEVNFLTSNIGIGGSRVKTWKLETPWTRGLNV